MRKRNLVVTIFILLAFAGCKDTANAAKWVGTYCDATGGLFPNIFNQVVIQEVNNNTIRIMADTALPPQAVSTYLTPQQASLQCAASDETNSGLGYLHSFLLNGTDALNGNTLTLPDRTSVYTTPFLITSTEPNNNHELCAYYRSF